MEMAKHFDWIETNIYSKHKDDAYEKQFTELLSLCIQLSITYWVVDRSIFDRNSWWNSEGQVLFHELLNFNRSNVDRIINPHPR